MLDVNDINPKMAEIDRIRIERGISVRNFCKKIGITTPTYYNYYYNKTKNNEYLINKMKQELNILNITDAELEKLEEFSPPPVKILRNGEIVGYFVV